MSRMEANNRWNETKFAILKALERTDCYLTPKEISLRTGLSIASVKNCLKRMSHQHYIWRHFDTRKGTKSFYMYQFLKAKGWRVLKKYKELNALGKPLRIKPKKKK